jgi:hypothetical protein
LLVPATSIGHLLTWEEGEVKELAQSRARSAVASLSRNGIKVVEAKVGDADPILAIEGEFLAGWRYEAIVISTLPDGVSRWIRMDVVNRLQRRHPRLRLIHVVAEDMPKSAPPSCAAS